MSKTPETTDGKAVPFRRLSRVAGLGGMAAKIAGGMAVNGAKQFASGARPSLTDLMMTPANARKVTAQLSNMRGAAMKIGQMISMDSGDILPKEFADILAQLRSDAQHMPRAQLDQVLREQWGEDWPARFMSFQYQPIAAASIGQVQRADLPSGEKLAIKVQYPGVRESIDSDVNNVAGLLKLTGLVPKDMDVSPIIEEGRRQLHEEADYLREAAYLELFGSLLSGDDDFEVPAYFPELSTDRVLAMSYIESLPIESLLSAPQETRNRVVRLLIELLLKELFEFGAMQTDPNFANYRYNNRAQKLVLLDFGASREVSKEIAFSYKQIMRAALSGDIYASFDAAAHIGFISGDMPERFKSAILDIIDTALEPLGVDADFDFGENLLAAKMRDKAMRLAGERELWHLPPPETVFIQRKIGGMYMLATRLRAQVNVRALMLKYVCGE